MAADYDDEQLEAAIERLIDAERFAEAERIVARAAPQLQKVLAAALDLVTSATRVTTEV